MTFNKRKLITKHWFSVKITDLYNRNYAFYKTLELVAISEK